MVHNPAVTADRILNDRGLGQFVAQTWARYFSKYVPMKSGILKSNYKTEPWTVTYLSPYAHYQWAGIKFVDPKYKKAGFHNADYSRWWSRPNIEKVPTTDPLKYNKEQNPLAASHWELSAYNAFEPTVADQISEFIRRM